ncbi:MAG TPA: PHP domain-containing protein [Candidatus Parcubacteria bacterium]|nr:PHP domain-containing protein [Candidatus Parcubacteria bacterium]
MKADLHIHTTFSDGLSSPKEVVSAAIKKGINCICVTDHNEIKGAIEAMRFAFDKDILVIPGIEVTTKSGHILGINVKKEIKKGLSPEKTIEEIRKQGGVAVIAHPFDWPTRSFRGGEKKILSFGSENVGIEAFNAGAIVKSSNSRALKFARKHNFIITAGSDAHEAKFIGRGYLELPDVVKSEEDLTQSLKNNLGEPKGEPYNWKELLRLAKEVKVSSGELYNFIKNVFAFKKYK